MAPDGRRIAFVSSRSGEADIWLLDLETRRLRNLTAHPGGDYRPAFSPDGKWIAFTSDRDSEGARAHRFSIPAAAVDPDLCQARRWLGEAARDRW